LSYTELRSWWEVKWQRKTPRTLYYIWATQWERPKTLISSPPL
jgi:hypothetical protein